ncbi:hypothetical protein ACIRBY_37165 [Streptomyces sp. NPDC096136]|uniref:hypothetical protein n=1 Tax=Streptomyces sp. NPDC096136 TaxID=3366076 RepID=UPI00380C1262
MRTEAPARRRRHARLVLALTELVGACAEAAAAVYRPIAEAPSTAEGVAVNRWPIISLAMTAAQRLDAADAEDAARWPRAVERELAGSQASFQARCAAAEADLVVSGLDPATPDGAPGTVPLPSAPQLAAMGLAGAGADLLEALDADPHEGLTLLRELTASGEYTAGEILDDATHTASVAGCLILQSAQRNEDPSGAAEQALAAARQFAYAVSIASLDMDNELPAQVKG